MTVDNQVADKRREVAKVMSAARLDPDVFNHTEPAASNPGAALTVLPAAVAVWRRRLASSLPMWTLVVLVTGGRPLASLRVDQQAGFAGRICPQQTITTRTSIASV